MKNHTTCRPLVFLLLTSMLFVVVSCEGRRRPLESTPNESTTESHRAQESLLSDSADSGTVDSSSLPESPEAASMETAPSERATSEQSNHTEHSQDVGPQDIPADSGPAETNTSEPPPTELRVPERPQTDTTPQPSCQDNQKNGKETDVDCGGDDCAPCIVGKKCAQKTDCQKGSCYKGRCCEALCAGKACGASDSCGGTCQQGSGCQVQPLPYPSKSLYHIKGLQPDFWPNRADVIGNNVGRIAVNLVWASWEPSVKSPPCASNEIAYDNHCFKLQQHVENEIKAYSAKGVVVTGVLYGVPGWARKGRVCSPATAGFEIFCAPNKASDYARFTGMIAKRYNGLNGIGRVADFVIHNEVNANDWFDVGCGQGGACDTTTWINTYADNYNAAYDKITKEQPHAKVLISLDHHFGTAFNKPTAQNPLLSGMTLLKGVAAKAGSRKWRVAFHSYPPNLRSATFSPDDFPKVTFGNLGVLAGWLRQNFSNTPSAWQIQLTENGINSVSPASPQKQATALCDAFKNILGTPGIESFIYHRMSDHPVEVNAGLAAGLRESNGTAKPAWAVWALANRNDLNPPKLSCGFEQLPYTKLTRYAHTTRGHWASTRVPPAGFKVESSWRLFREPKAGTRMLYECRVGQHNIITPALNCENQEMLGPVGYIYTSQQSNTVALYRCRVGNGQDHFISPSTTCEGQNKDMLLGYAPK